MSDPLVLLPGMMCDARLFMPQIEAMSSTRSIMVCPLTDGESIEQLASYVLQRAPSQFALAGLSMGGIVAMEVVRQAPERVSKLALLDTNARAETPERQALRESQMERARAGDLRAIMRDEMKPNYLADGPNTGAILDLCMVMAESLGPEVFCQQSIALRDRRDQSDALRQYSGSTLVICGESDQLCPIENHQYICELMQHARLCVVAGAGHLPTLEQPEAITIELTQWLLS